MKQKIKKSLITLTVILTAAALVVVFSGQTMAKVSGRCDNCHTMHNSQGGTAMAEDRSSWYDLWPELGTPPYGTLLTDTCVGCHSHDSAEQQYQQPGGCWVPVVFYRSGQPDQYLAGGNFAFVVHKGNAYGHNVLGISGVDTDLLGGAPGDPYNCANSCHKTLAEVQTRLPEFGSGCQGCHLRPAHHADDSAIVVGGSTSSTDGYYRFLTGHSCYEGAGVCGIEDADWQAECNAGDHNEYLGHSCLGIACDKRFEAGFYNLGQTMTAFCCGCHGNFHITNTEADGSGSWIRHPSDAVIPDTPGSEYADAFGANGTGTGSYDPNVPVARPSLTGWTGPSPGVTLDTDMVMCLSCHRPHGSPYDNLLRWDYGDMLAGGGANTTGCFACHTKKDTGS